MSTFMKNTNFLSNFSQFLSSAKLNLVNKFFTKTVHFGSISLVSIFLLGLCMGNSMLIEPNFFNKQNTLVHSSATGSKLAATSGIGELPESCGEKTISINSIVTPGAFFPVIPCGLSSDGKDVQPLSPALIPDIMIRAFGMIASLTFYLFTGILVLSGVLFIWDGINGNTRKQAERNLYDTIWALVLIFGTYTILMTILTLLNFDFAKTNVQFFDFGIS